jgi:PAS domain S-box-containing protein
MAEIRRTALVESDERFRLLVESVKDYAIFMLDVNGYVLTWNAGAERIKGYSASDIIGQHFSKFYPQDAIDRRHPDYELSVATETGRFEEEGWRVRKDGSLFWANVVITALRDSQGVLRGFGKVTRDLTQRREHEQTLRQSEERFRLLVEGVNDYAIFMLNENGEVATWNAGAERIKGYTASEIIGKHFSQFYPEDAVKSGWPEHELHVATTQGRFAEEGWRVRKDGTHFWAHVTITALRDEDGRLRGFAKVTRDLTERMQAVSAHQRGTEHDEMLAAERAARLQAQRAVRMKDEFLGTLSHELRTPLQAILGWVQVLRSAPSPLSEPDVRQAVAVIERNAKAQVTLIEDLLDLNRILAGQVRLDLQRVALVDVIGAAVDSAKPAAEAKGIRIEMILDARRGVVSGDAARLQQVVWNLLSNAVKFTRRDGKVQVLLERINSHVEITVSDTGVGIPEDFLPHVFDRFSQRDSGAGRRYGGLGLGLAITKQLVELHGGTVSAKSAGEGKGASFIVRIPLALVDDSAGGKRDPVDAVEQIETAALPELKGAHILAVDDEADARELMRRALQTHGARVTTVDSAEQALAVLKTVTPDVLVSDIGMPEGDGYQLMRTIRAGEPKGVHVPALALTAFARSEDRKRAMLAGFDAHLAKPFDLAEFLLVIARLVNRKSH